MRIWWFVKGSSTWCNFKRSERAKPDKVTPPPLIKDKFSHSSLRKLKNMQLSEGKMLRKMLFKIAIFHAIWLFLFPLSQNL